MIAKTDSAGSRIDLVWIRKSSGAQIDEGQVANVKRMLKEQGFPEPPPENWLQCTVPRADVSTNEDFRRLLELVKSGRVRTVYIESQKRFGTKNNRELFQLLDFFTVHDTRLYDLRERMDLTEEDDNTELRVVLGGQNSLKERKDISFQSLRSRITKVHARSWPTGCHPFGYGKECRSAEGRLLWRFEPVSRTHGHVIEADSKGQLVRQKHPRVEKIRRKGKTDVITLVPGDRQHVKTVQLVFELYTRQTLSRRQIAIKLNGEGKRYYDKPFNHSLVTQILANPAYVGDTHFGKVQMAKHYSFDAQGNVTKLKRPTGKQKRAVEDRTVVAGTHKPLIDRQTWELAQQKLAKDQPRKTFAPRNAAYYLKPLLVCKHCGRNMTGRIEAGKTVYVCSSYVRGRSSGQGSSCGYHRITHEEAELILLAKLRELNLQYESSPLELAKSNVEQQFARLDQEDAQSIDQWKAWLDEGLDALVRYLKQEYGFDAKALRKARAVANHFYWDRNRMPTRYDDLPLSLKQLRKAIEAAESASVEKAKVRLAEVRTEHEQFTRSWAKATELQQAVLQKEITSLEAEIQRLEPLTTKLSERLMSICQGEDQRQADRQKLEAEWPAMQAREKGEALRRIFQTVKLSWERTFHPASLNPSRPRKTKRDGRYSYELLRDQIEFGLTDHSLAGSW